MTQPTLTIIEGGLSAPQTSGKKQFLSAYITNTRLMGVIGLYIHWHLPDYSASPDFHQFFYLDAEEYGFETYKSILGNDVEEISLVEQALIGGLGGNKVEISEREARYLLCEYAMFNQRRGLPLPGDLQEYAFLIETPTLLNPNEQKLIMTKQCDEIVSDYQVMNYFLMRCFSKDYEAAAYLADGEFAIDLYDTYKFATLCKNTIDEDIEEGTYLCESLVEDHDSYDLVVSQIKVKNHKIVAFKHCSGFQVSPAEAAMMLSRPEFITVYELLMTPEDLDCNLQDLKLTTMSTAHENGRLFLSFNKTNSHVNRKVFLLSADIFGLYYITEYGQLIVSAYNISSIQSLEKDLRKSALAPYLVATAKYEFKEPILYEFIQSDFEDFNDFLDFIRND